MDNHRRHERIEQPGNAELTTAGDDKPQLQLQLRTANHSVGGVFVTSDDTAELNIGDEVELAIDGDGISFRGKAKVVHNRAHRSEDGAEQDGYGLMFLAEETLEPSFQSGDADRFSL